MSTSTIQESPLVAIVTPIYATEENNLLTLFDEAYQSIVNQNFNDFVWVIVNHGSTVDVRTHITNLGLESKLDDRIIIIDRDKKDNELSTPSIPRNEGIDFIFDKKNGLINVEYLMFFDADDILRENTISRMLQVFQNGDKIFGNEKTGMVLSSFQRFDYTHSQKSYRAVNKAYSSIVPPQFQKYHNATFRLYSWTTPIVGAMPVMLRKNFITDVRNQLGYKNESQNGIWNPNIVCSEDRELLLQCGRALRTYKQKKKYKWGFLSISDATLEYRINPAGLTSINLQNDNQIDIKWIEDHHLNDVPKIVKSTILTYRKSKFWLRINYTNYIPFKGLLSKIRDKIAPNFRLYRFK